ncbi:MAG: ABC transporter permease [Thermaerobacter sp.]|nr:ABC transporter permease [Thermaerobacter sp.]
MRSGAPERGSLARGAWHQAATLGAFTLREYRIWQSYRVNQLMWLTNIFVTTLLFFLMGRMLTGADAHLLGPAYGTNYMSFVVVGIAVNVFLFTNLADPYTRIQRAYFNGTMDLFLLSPMSIYTPLVGLMTKSLLDDYPRLFIVGAFGVVLFGAVFRFEHWLLAAGFTVLLLAAAFGIGAISASSFYLLNIKRGTEPVRFIVQQLLATLLAGTYYPITVLPRPLQWVACLIPHAYAFDALRRLMDPGARMNVPVLPIQQVLPWPPLTVDAVALGVMAGVLLPLGFWLYGRGIEKARRDGTLTRWQ